MKTFKSDIKHPLWVLLLLAILVLLPAVFSSFELCDTGFYLTFYNNFFPAPDNVEYNFMYYLTGVFGGIVESFGETGSMLRMRIAGLLFLLGATTIAWFYSRKTVSSGIITIALLGVLAGYTSSPIILSYDIVSILFLSLTVFLLAKGILKSDWKMLYFSGIIAGILIFARIPNLLQFFLILLIPLYSSKGSRDKWRFSLIYTGGYVTGILTVFALMGVLGHFGIFIENINTLLHLSSDPEASHGIGNLIMTQIFYYMDILRVMVKIAIIAFALWTICRIVKTKWLRILLFIPISIYFVYVAWSISAVKLIGAVVLPALILMSLKRKKRNESLVAAGALLSSLIFPLGSDGAGGNIGSILYLLGAAPAMKFWMDFSINSRFGSFYIPRKTIWGASVSFILICIIRTLSGGLYFDDNPIWKMTSTSSSPKLKGIMMSEDRREVVDEMLPVINRYVSPGDTLMAYGSIPVVNYLTSTRPYFGNSWPEQVSAGRLKYLLKEEERQGHFPVICIQRFHTLGRKWGEPSDAFMKGLDSDSDTYHSAKKWLVIEDFLVRNSYNKIDSTPHFEIYSRE